MRFTDIFIKRPVLATVISLLIFVLGIRSLSLLQIRQYPFTENAVITVSTVYTGADPALVAGFITTPLENSIAQAQGIDYLTSSSTQGSSSIQANLRLNYDPNRALTEVNTKVNAVLNQLPKASQQPTLSITVGETIDSMYLGFYSQQLASNNVTDYLVRVVQPKLQSIDGVQQAEILGQRQFALRAWLDPAKLVSYGITANEVAIALANNDFIAAVGRTKGEMITVDLTIETGLKTVEEFKNLIVKAKNGAIIRLKDVAKVTLGAQNYDTAVKFDNKPAVYIGIKVAPTANVLSVIKNVRKAFPNIQQQLPQGLKGEIVYDESRYINSAISEVIHSLIEALIIVTAVIFIFLGSIRSVVIPVIAMPLSLIGSFLIMLLLGYTINLLTLLALVLAIGLVVDDAIIIVENIFRHIEAGETPFNAAIKGARELAIPIISISVVLVAVYVPIGFMGGLTGALFTEFAFTLAGAVAISAIIALTLSPMMCSKSLKPTKDNNNPGFVVFIDRQFEKIRDIYECFLHSSLDNVCVTGVFAIIILSSIYFLYATSKSELTPQEDQGLIISLLTAAPNASLEQTQLYSKQVFKIFEQFPETDHVFQLDGVNGLNSSIGGMVFKPWDERKRTTNQLQPVVQQLFSHIAGARVAAFQKPSLPGGGSGLPVQFVITTTDSYDKLNEVSQRLLDEARKSGLFVYLDTDLKIDKAQTAIQLDRDKAAQLGLSMADVGSVLASALSEGYINYFDFSGRSYQVIPQVMRSQRLNANQILNYYLMLPNGSSIPLSTIARLKTTVVPESINHFQQLNSATISAVAFPGVTMGDALQGLKNMAGKIFPEGYGIDYAAQSRQYQQESSALILTFFLALVIIFLCLAAQFESFRDPLIILISVPMSICGALIFISLGIGGASLNIYTEVGLVTLIGLISKHGILIVQFANDLQKEGHAKREAVQMAAGIRLRPILMTTASMVLGVIPLILATGAGAISRFNIGLVIATGISIGTLFTLFVVPAMYLFLAQDHYQPNTSEAA
ncbi:acriflavin resistance protein [Candidatus Rickettsiella viridis]|uniref:Acriflavin resistance protein n=1 Tax=Candidatus Rickettsiella viridis TaxID=676208 RepID=A0A2Z5UXE9_9COXI|nr:efflux RND transporter permease subunit [Candidatus Rickettsiella viridis]BBB15753.1 acriflavin resistance protein [Candidatus Rickettsiella viridis]